MTYATDTTYSADQPCLKILIRTRISCGASVLTCEAGVSIKPGASAPGSQSYKSKARESAAKAEINRGLSPVITGYNFKRTNPGAHAPGFMLAPASLG